jgi:hypothetical protein
MMQIPYEAQLPHLPSGNRLASTPAKTISADPPGGALQPLILTKFVSHSSQQEIATLCYKQKVSS